MIKALSLLSIFSVLTLAACHDVSDVSPRGGGMTRADGFRVIGPHDVLLQQGAVQTVNIGIDRGELFKKDVKLTMKASPGITVDPGTATVKASSAADALIKISAAKDAALGEYRVTITGTPTTGEQAMTEFRVRVVTP